MILTDGLSSPQNFGRGVGLRKGGAVLLSVQSNGSLAIANAKTLAASREKTSGLPETSGQQELALLDKAVKILQG